jgi:hypothetical protein
MMTLDSIRIRLEEAEACRAMLVYPHQGLDARVATWRAAMEEALAAGAKPPPSPREIIFTPERVAKLTDLWLTPTPLDDIRAALNALPGPEITSNRKLTEHAKYRRLKGRRRFPGEDTLRRAGAAISTAKTSFTPDRDAALREGWQRGDAPAVILAAINALPGDPISEYPMFRRRLRLGLPDRDLRGRNGPATQTKFTPERDAALRQGWLRGDSPRVILAEINALPGKPVTESPMFNRRKRLGLPDRGARADRDAEAIAVRRAMTERGQATSFTPERDAALRSGWAAGDTPAVILAAINALPGPPIRHLGTMFHRRKRLGLPERAMPSHRAAKPAPASVAPPPAPAAFQPPSAPPQAQETPEELRARQEAMARDMVREGHADSQIRDQTGLDLVRIAELTVEVAAEADAAQARRLAKARDMLRKRAEPTVITAHTRLPLREVFRLQAEMRREGKAA